MNYVDDAGLCMCVSGAGCACIHCTCVSISVSLCDLSLSPCRFVSRENLPKRLSEWCQRSKDKSRGSSSLSETL